MSKWGSEWVIKVWREGREWARDSLESSTKKEGWKEESWRKLDHR